VRFGRTWPLPRRASPKVSPSRVARSSRAREHEIGDECARLVGKFVVQASRLHLQPRRPHQKQNARPRIAVGNLDGETNGTPMGRVGWQNSVCDLFGWLMLSLRIDWHPLPPYSAPPNRPATMDGSLVSTSVRENTGMPTSAGRRAMVGGGAFQANWGLTVPSDLLSSIAVKDRRFPHRASPKEYWCRDAS
jgi:hypothetical protein